MIQQQHAGAAPHPDVEPLGLASGLLLFAPLAIVANALGSLLRYPDIGAAVLFPPYAVLTAALVLSPRRTWVWYILVGTLAHFVTSWPQWSVSWVLVADAANIVRALIAAVLLRWSFNGRPRFDGVDMLARFVASAAIIAPAVGATIGAANVVLHGVSTSFWRPWSAWFMSNALTGLTLLPALVFGGSAIRWRGPRASRRRVLEGVALVVALALAGTIAFLTPVGGRWHLALLLYAPLPVLIWTALRFGAGAASLGLTVVACMAIWGSDRDIGLFLATSPDENVLVLQLFVLLTTLPVLCIAAVSEARRGVVRLHRALLASLHDHVAILDARGVVLETNDSWRRLAELSGAAFHRADVGDDFAAACRLSASGGDATAERALAGVLRVLHRDVRRFEMEYDDVHGEQRSRFALSIEALERAEGGAVVTRADVTVRHHTQLEIDEQRRELSHLARVAALGQLSGAFAHELNQPLTSISSNAEAARHLIKRHPVDLGEIDAILRDIVAADQRAAQVIRRLRALLRRGDTRLQSMDAAELVDEVLELARGELIARRVTASATVGPALPPVLADRVQLQQVLLNLILNGCEAMRLTPATDRRLSLTLDADAADNLHFSIRDRGIGIPAPLIDHLFEPFVTTKAEGLGLGLSISRTIVAAHGGRLWAENNADGGATVHCLLPAAKRRATAESPRRDVSAEPSPEVAVSRAV